MAASGTRLNRSRVGRAFVGAAFVLAGGFAAPLSVGPGVAGAGSGYFDSARLTQQGAGSDSESRIEESSGCMVAEDAASAASPSAVRVPPSRSRFDAPDVHRPGPGLGGPRVIHRVHPNYTPSAMRRQVQGVVSLEVLIDEIGEVVDVRVVEPLDAELDASAVRAACTWRFEPWTKDGVAVMTAVVVELQFTIH